MMLPGTFSSGAPNLPRVRMYRSRVYRVVRVLGLALGVAGSLLVMLPVGRHWDFDQLPRIITRRSAQALVERRYAPSPGAPASGSHKEKTEILWDTYGVPHIYAQSIEEMYYGFGYAQMRNHANLMLQLYDQARGRAAEYWGVQYLESDKMVHLFELPRRARQHYDQQEVAYRRYLESFVLGVNAYAQAHPGAIGAQYKAVLPVTPQDVLAHVSRVMSLTFVGGREAETEGLMPPGSNAYAIAPARSASGRALLMANPHLPWEDLFLFFEAHLNAPGFMAYGACLVGQPVLNIAFNNHLGWTHTVNTIDAADRYVLSLQEDGYLLDGVKQLFKKTGRPEGEATRRGTYRANDYLPLQPARSGDGKPYR